MILFSSRGFEIMFMCNKLTAKGNLKYNEMKTEI